MADNYLITGYWGEPHVTAENDRGINAAMFGTGRFVLPVGEQFKAEYIGNNTIRMYDGKLMDNGAAAGIPVGEYVDLLIANAGQGMKRNDLIVFQYEQDSSTLVESGKFVVIQGAESSGTASDPALTQEDLLSGEAAFDQFALWRVSVSGATISAPVKLFSVYQNNVSHAADKNNPHKVTAEQIGAAESSHSHSVDDIADGTLGVSRGGTGKATHTSNAVLTGNGTSSVKNVATASGALYATAANGAPKFGVLPIAQGGTGKTTASAALSALGAAAASHTHSKVTLWQNASPNSTFATQTVNLSNYTNYNVLFIVVKGHKDNGMDNVWVEPAIPNQAGGIQNNVLYSTGADAQHVKRGYAWNSSGIFFGNGSYQQGTAFHTSDDFCIPLAIYGI